MSANAGSLWLFKEFWGFDAIPIDMDFDIFMKVLLNCANGDGQLTTEERAWVAGYTAALGGPTALVEELNQYAANEVIPDLVAQRQTVIQSARALVYDAIRTCSADGEYHADEQALVHRLAAQLGVPDDVVKQLEDSYAEDRKLRRKRLELIWNNGQPY